MKLIARVGDDRMAELRMWPWFAPAYREFDRCETVWAPLGVNVLVRWWRFRRSYIYSPLIRARLYFVEPNALYTTGHFCWPWSACWYELEKKMRSESYASGIAEGRQLERAASEEHFQRYLETMRLESEMRHAAADAEVRDG